MPTQPSLLFRLAVVLLLAGCERDVKHAKPATTAGTTSATAPQPPELATTWQPAGAGVEVRRWPALGGAHVVRADPSRCELAWVAVQGGDAAVGSVDSALQDRRVHAAINAGFFDARGQPMGLRISGGDVKHTLRKADWGIFFVRDGRPGQVHTSDRTKIEGAEFAIQCGPRLLQGGESFKLKPGRHRRSFIGSDAAGRVYLGVTLSLVDLNELAGALGRPEKEGGLSLCDALNLDGGPSSELRVRAAEGAWDVAGGSGVAGAIILRARRR